MNYEDLQQQDDDDEHHNTLQQTTVNGHQNSNFTNNNTIPNPSDRPTNDHLNPPTRYRECLKNHAVGLGRHAVDGCGEFIPSLTGDDGGAPESLTCAACSCHRNFHRKEEQQHTQNAYRWHASSSYNHNPHVHVAHPPPPRRGLLALPPPRPDGGQCNNIGSDNKCYENPNFNNNVLVKKRHRTKFTQEQKQKMLSFAESVAWRVQKQDSEVMQRFCGELGITKQVLKVWMHNNKNTLGNKKIILEGESSKNVSG